jgi:hypothetical protein
MKKIHSRVSNSKCIVSKECITKIFANIGEIEIGKNYQIWWFAMVQLVKSPVNLF